MYDDDEVDDQGLNDEEALAAARSELPAMTVPEPPPLPAIVARGRALRRRRRAKLAGTGAVAVAVTLAVAVTSIGGNAAKPGRTVGLGSGHSRVDLADFSVNSRANGTVTVSWRQVPNKADAVALRYALAKAGVPAVVKVGSFCSGTAVQVRVSPLLRGWAGAAPARAAMLAKVARYGPSANAIVIKPGALARTAQLSIGYVDRKVAVTVVPLNARLSCSGAPPVCYGPVAVGGAAPAPPGTATGTTLPEASTVPASTEPASTAPASTLPGASTVPASTLPASTPAASVAAGTVPAATLVPASTLVPATTNGPSPAARLPGGAGHPPLLSWCVVQMPTTPVPVSAGNTTTLPVGTTTLPVSSTTVPGAGTTTTLPVKASPGPSKSVTTTLPAATQ